MAVKLTINLDSGPCCLNCCQHVSATIRDLNSNKVLIINFTSNILKDPSLLVTNIQSPDFAFTYADEKSNLIEQECCPCSRVHLYSHKDFDEFCNVFRDRYPSASKYQYCFNNCSDAINFALNELCPDTVLSSLSCFLYKALCAPVFFAFCCSITIVPSIFCTTPADTFRKARWLAKMTDYGKEITANYNSQVEIKIETQEPTNSSAEFKI